MAQRATFPSCSVASLFFGVLFVCVIIYISNLRFSSVTTPTKTREPVGIPKLKVYIADLPKEMNYGLLEDYWSKKDSRAPPEDFEGRKASVSAGMKYPPYPMNPLIRQYSAEYWLLGDLLGGSNSDTSVAQTVSDFEEADVVFVPFFATLSAEMQLDRGKGKFRHKKVDNEDYRRQRKVLDLVKSSAAWQRSGGRDHVFVLTDPVAMWHVREEISLGVLLVVDFGGWYREDSKNHNPEGEGVIHHTQVSLLKDVIVPYTHLLPRLHVSENPYRQTLLYFKGARHRHRGGMVREKLWDLLQNEPGVILEEGFPNITGREQAISGMRNAEFCLHPAGDTPTSCRLFDAIASLCIPVIISDNIELPFEGMIDYTKFSIFVSVQDALQAKWLVSKLKGMHNGEKDSLRNNMAQIQHVFEYDSRHPGGIGPALKDGAVNHIWRKLLHKVPAIKEAVTREKRKPNATYIPLRCHCI